MSSTDLLADQVFVNLLSDAVSLAIQRVGRVASDRVHKARKRTDSLDALASPSFAIAPSLPALANLPNPPANAHEITEMLARPTGRTILNQVAAAVLLESYDQHRTDLILLVNERFAAMSISASAEQSGALLDSIASAMEPIMRRDASDPQSRALATLSARSILTQSMLESISRDVRAMHVASTRAESTDLEWLAAYRAQCARKHGVITPPDNNRRTTVPLEDIYVPGRLHRGEGTESVLIYDALPAVDRTVILGTPGGGKSTATHAIALKLASDDTALVPLVVVLRDFARFMESSTLADYIETTIGPRYEVSKPPRGLIEALLREGRAFVLLDGLDELLDPSARRSMAEKVELFSSSFPSAPLLVTSRLVGYKEAALNETIFESLTLASYDEKDVELYAAKWFELNAAQLQLDDGRTVAEIRQAFLAESASINDLRTNPLLLSLLCIIYRGQNYLPRHRVGVYERCTELLFETWDRGRGITFDFDFDDLLKDAFKHLAFWMFTTDEGGEGIPEGPLVAELTEFFQTNLYETHAKSRVAAREFIDFCKGRAWILTEVGLAPDDEPLFAFVHRTFLEFYTAAQLTRVYATPEKLARQLVVKVSKSEWDTVGQLAVHITNRTVVKGAEKVLERLLSAANAANRTMDYRSNVLTFIVRCLEDMPATPSFLRKVFRPLARALSDSSQDGVTDATLEFALASLYSLDTSGDYLLLNELEEFLRSEITSKRDGRQRARLVAGSCIRDADEREASLYRLLFVEDWANEPNPDYDDLRTGYFANCLDADELIALTLKAGGAALDSLFYERPLTSPLPTEGRYHCVAFAMIESYRLWPEKHFSDWVNSGERWVGSLLADLASIVRASRGPLVSAGLTADLISFMSAGFRRASKPEVLSDDQLTSVLFLSCVVTEMCAPERIDVGTLEALPLLRHCQEAAERRSWDSSKLSANWREVAVVPQLRAWAAAGGRGLLRE